MQWFDDYLIQNQFLSIEQSGMKAQINIEGENKVNELYDQFKFHLIYQNKIKQSKNIITDALKDLLSEVKRDNKHKKHVKKTLQENIHNLNKYQSERRPVTVQSRLWRPPTIDPSSLQTVKEEILVVENEGENLRGEIAKLEERLVTLKSNIKDLKSNLKQQNQKEQKYKHIEYLSRNIQRSTQNSKLSNTRSYKKLLKYQDEIITNLKKFKSSLKKENQTIQTRFVQFQQKKLTNMIQSKLRYFVHPKHHIDLEEYSHIKIDSPLICKLQQLLNLFKDKQVRFEEIKSEMSTKIRLKKINKNYLKQDRIKFHEMIQKFQDCYDVKIQSLPNLVIYFFHQLRESNEEIENQCIKRTEIRQSLVKEFEELKSRRYFVEEDIAEFKEPLSSQLNPKEIHKYSAILLQTINLIHQLLAKFKYLFNTSLTLSLQNKNFQPLLAQINHIYSKNNIFTQQSLSQSEQVDYNITNYKQIQALLNDLQQKFPLNKEEILSFMFNDLRYGLIIRFNWIEQELRSCNDENELMQKIAVIHSRCQEIYTEKLKNYFITLEKCFKALAMNKYERKVISCSNAKQSLFLELFRDIKLINIEGHDDYEANEEKENYDSVNKFNTQENDKCVVEKDVFARDNPATIIKMLEKVKNKNKQIFRPINVEITKNYIPNTKIVIPKIK